MLVLALAAWLLLTGLLVWLLIYCLRVGAVGAGKWQWNRNDVHRDKQPVRFWTGIAALAVGAVGMIAISFEAIWVILH